MVARLEEARMMATVAKWIRMTAAATKRRARERVADILIGKNIQEAGIRAEHLMLKLMGRQELREFQS
jgi:hypothetical protein